MLKECQAHGYFRDEYCPVCGSEARFLLNDQEVDMLGRTMAGVLRHFPERYELAVDKNGWIDLRDFLTAIQSRNRRLRFLKPHHIIGLVETDPKGRYQFQDGRLRATYGHTFDVELDLPTENIPETLFYPTSEADWPKVQQEGLKPTGDQKMVHLSRTFEAALEAGRVRNPTPVILEVDTRAARGDGVVVMKAGKTVYLTREVAPQYIRRAERVEEELPPAEGSPDSLP